MSRIDTTKTLPSAGAPSSERIARALGRNEPVPVGNVLPQREREAFAPALSSPVLPKDEAVSVDAVAEADLAPLSAIGADRMLGELARIDVALAGEAEANAGDAEFVAAMDVGRDMISEVIRRVRLIQAGQDSLVVKR